MITYNMTAGVDNELIWLVRVNLDDVTFRFSDVVGGISLDGNTWDAAVMDWEQWRQTQLDKAIDLTGGGSLGSIGNFEFAIQRYNAFSGLSNYFEDVYPATGARYLTSRVIEIGYVWSGATSESDITWEAKYYIRKFPYTDNKMTLICFEINDLANRELPYYKVQKDYDNGISYFTNAPDNSYEKVIPIVYGSLTLFSLISEQLDLGRQIAPSVCVDKELLKYLFASHKLNRAPIDGDNATANVLYRYIDGLDTYLKMIPNNGQNNNTQKGCWVSLLNSTHAFNDTVLGELIILNFVIGKKSNVNTLDGLNNNDNDTGVTLEDTKRLSLKIEGDVSNSKIGILGTGASDIKVTVGFKSTDAGQKRYAVLSLYNELEGDYSVPEIWDFEGTTSYGNVVLNMGDVTDFKNNSELPWTIEELQSIEYNILNNTSNYVDGDVGDIIVTYARIELTNIWLHKFLPTRANFNA